MKNKSMFYFIPVCALLWLLCASSAPCEPWAGVDETVVEKFAVQAGRPPQRPFIPTDQGDLLLFVFLVAGAAGGFLAGYCFRDLFGKASKKPDA